MNKFYQHPQVCALLTPWGRFLLEKLTVPQLVKKFLTFSGSRRIISTFTRALPPAYMWRCILLFLILATSIKAFIPSEKWCVGP
jgi:hypothetical protein